MQPVASALGTLGRVLTIELPGHGSTPLGSTPFGMSAFVDALGDALSALALYDDGSERARPLVFGYSMGGYVALALEAERPGTLGGIVTLGTKFMWTPEYATREGARLDARVMLEKVPKFAALLDERHAACGGWHALLGNTRRVMQVLGAAPLLTRASLARVGVPVMIAVGERDDTVSIDEAREVAAWMPKARAESLPDAPHPIERVPVALVVRAMEAMVHTLP